MTDGIDSLDELDEEDFFNSEQYEMYVDIVELFQEYDSDYIECDACHVLREEFDYTQGPPNEQAIEFASEPDRHEFSPGCILLRFVQVVGQYDV